MSCCCPGCDEDSYAITGRASEVYMKAPMRRLAVIWGEVTDDSCVVTRCASVGLRGMGGDDSCIVTRRGVGHMHRGQPMRSQRVCDADKGTGVETSCRLVRGNR